MHKKKGEGDDSPSHVKREGGGSGQHHGTSPEDLQNKVFVGGLPLHVDKEGLTDFFSCFGPVTDVSFIQTLYNIIYLPHHVIPLLGTHLNNVVLYSFLQTLITKIQT